MSMSALPAADPGHRPGISVRAAGRTSYLWISPRERIPAAIRALPPAPPLFAAMRRPSVVWAVAVERPRWRGRVFWTWRRHLLDLWSERPWRRKASRRSGVRGGVGVPWSCWRRCLHGAPSPGPPTLMSSFAAPVPGKQPGQRWWADASLRRAVTVEDSWAGKDQARRTAGRVSRGKQ